MLLPMRSSLKYLISIGLCLLVVTSAIADTDSYIKRYMANDHQPFKNLELSAANGNSSAMFRYGYRLEHGIGTKVDKLAALNWYTRSAIRGTYGAMDAAQELFSELKQQRQHYLDLTTQKINSIKGSNTLITQYNIVGLLICSEMQSDSVNVKEVCREYFSSLQENAREGNADSMFWLGYAESREPWTNHADSMNWTEKAFIHGINSGAYEISMRYRIGEGVTEDLHKTEAWLIKSADSGNSQAMFKLARDYEDGLYAKPDTYKAVMRFEQAARAGVPEAAAYLSALYRLGKYVPKNEQVAYRWHLLTHLKFDEIPAMAEVYSRLSVTQRTQARAEAEEIRKAFEAD